MPNGQGLLDWRRSQRQQADQQFHAKREADARKAWEQSYRGRQAIAAGFTHDDYLHSNRILAGEESQSVAKSNQARAIPAIKKTTITKTNTQMKKTPDAESKDKDERLYGLVSNFVEEQLGADTVQTRTLQDYATKALNDEVKHGRQKLFGIADAA